MSVTIRQASRTIFHNTIPVLRPLYSTLSGEWPLLNEGETVCGRGEQCQLVLLQEGIAELHCVLTFRSGQLTVRRLNGRIWVNDLPVPAESPLVPGDVLSFGAASFQIEAIERPEVRSNSRLSSPGSSVPGIHPFHSAPQPLIHHANNGMSEPGSMPAHADTMFRSPAGHSPASAESPQIQHQLHAERQTLFEAKDRVQEQRERQINDLSNVLLERERAVMQRQQALDERASILNERTVGLDQQQNSLESLRQKLRHDRGDLDLRLQELAERELEFADQVRSSQAATARFEEMRARFIAREEEFHRQEERLRVECDELRRQADSFETYKSRVSAEAEQLARSVEEVAARRSDLETRDAELRKSAEALAQREQAAQGAESLLAEAKSRLIEADERDRSLLEREREFVGQAGRLEQAAEALQTREAEIAQQQAEVDTLTARIRQADSELAMRAEDLASHTIEIEARALELAEIQRAATETSSHLAEQAADIEARNLELQIREQAAQNREQMAQSREEQLSERERLTQHQSDELNVVQSDLMQQLAAVEQQKGELNQQAEELEQQSRELESQRLAMKTQAENSSPPTQSVGELAAIAAEREDVIRTRQEVMESLEQLRIRQDGLQQEETAIRGWQTEIDSRAAELADRVSALKLLKASIQNRSQEVEQAAVRTEGEIAALHLENEKFAQRMEEVAAAELKVAELQSAVRVAQRNAEGERESLQNSHKDLLCEKNSLSQMSQDLQSRASGLAERESIVIQQTEELRSRFLAVNQQSTSLQKEESELNLRAVELHRRVTQFKTELHEHRSRAVGDTDHLAAEGLLSDSDVTRLSESLRESESQRMAAVAERDAFLTAVHELQRAMMDVRADVEDAARIRTEAVQQEQTLNNLYKTIEERSAQLQLLESKLLHSEEQCEVLKTQIAALTTQLTAEWEQASSEPVTEEAIAKNTSTDERQEALLLEQLESLRAEMQESASENSVRQQEYQRTAAQREDQVAQLEQQILEMQTQLETLMAAEPHVDHAAQLKVAAIYEQLARSQGMLREQESLIRELQARLSEQFEHAGTTDPSVDPDTLHREARELDHRADLLDDREVDLSERARRVTQSEENLDSERRELQNARQQLELARAQVQEAMQQHAVRDQMVPPALPLFAAERAIEQASEHEQVLEHGQASGYEEDAGQSLRFPDESLIHSENPVFPHSDNGEQSREANDLRAELASLFGLKSPIFDTAPESESEPAPERAPAAFVDLTEPTGESSSVAFRFGDNASQLVENLENISGEAESEPAREENSDDFVRDYMEQLLARSRKSAGNTLPTELKPQTRGNSPQAASAVAPAKATDVGARTAPKTKSFIDDYMAGSYKDLNLDGPGPADDVAAHAGGGAGAGPNLPLAPRVKVDRQKLREDMDSFRSLSTQSVENALVNHALRRERTNISGRIMLTFVLVIMSIFLAIANGKGIIRHPSLIWVTMVAAIGAGAELARKWCSVRNSCKISRHHDGRNEDTAVQDLSTTSDAHASTVIPATAVDQCEVNGIGHATLDLPPHAGTNSADTIVGGTPVSGTTVDGAMPPHRIFSDRHEMEPRPETDPSEYFEL